jgi:hypothetical protein
MAPHLFLESLEVRELLDASAFPSTASKIGIISDEFIEGNLQSQALIKYIATHMDGVQKEWAAYNQLFRNYNPNWVLLYYKLATEAGPVPYIIDNNWGSDWNTVNANESWFMHNASGQRLTNSANQWDQLDPTNTAWQQYWLNQVNTNIQESGAQGVFADSFEAGIGPGWYDEYDVRFADTNSANPVYWPNGYTWIDQLQNWATIMQNGLNQTPGAPLFIPNIDGMNTFWTTLNYAQLPAGFAEGFGDYGPTYLGGNPSDWNLAMNRALQITDQNKVFIIQSYLQFPPNSTQGLWQRGFDLGSYLLLKSDHTYLNMASAPTATRAFYYPEYTINLGPALAPPATDVSQYLWNNVYRRDFQNGIVLVNPTSTTYTVTLPQSYALVSYLGGGELTDASLDSAGNYIAGDLSTTPVTNVTLGSGQTVILMNPALLPGNPSGLTATGASGTQIKLAWIPATGATAYWVERNDATNTWKVLATLDGNTTSYTDSSLAPGVYSYRVVAGNTYGNSGYSNVAKVVPDQFSDPGFEIPSAGTGSRAYLYNPSGAPWTYSGSSGVAGNGSIFTAGNLSAPDGSQVAFLQATGTISQNVPFTAGTYTVSFEAAQRQNVQASSQTFAVTVDGQVVGTFTPTSTNYARYITNAFAVTDGEHTVSFVGLDPDGGDNTAFVDSASIDLVTPPNAFLDPGFEIPNVGIGSSAYVYDPTELPGYWIYSGGAGIAGNVSVFTSGNPNAPQGTQVAFLQGNGSVSQAVTFTAGTYSISVQAGQRALHQASSQTFAVEVDGQVVGTILPTSTSYASYSTNSFSVTGGKHTVMFVGLDPNGGDNTAFIDEASIIMATPTNDLLDPGFETPSVGSGPSAYVYNPSGTPWTYSTGSGVAGNGSDFSSGNPNAPQGSQVAFLQATGTISQTINMSAGSYAVSFEAAQRQNWQASSQTFAVEIDGQIVGTFTANSTNYAVYTTNPFTVAAGSHVLSFVGLDPNGGDNTAFIDAVSLAPPPVLFAEMLAA